jgi:hypothetical protein
MAASPPVKPRLPSWKGRQMSREGPSPKKTPTRAKAAQFSGLSEAEREVGGEDDDVVGDAGVDPRFGRQQAGHARGAHGGDPEGGTVEVELLVELGEDGRGHEAQPLPLGGPEATFVVVGAPGVDIAEDVAVDDADDSSRAPAPVEGVLDGLAAGGPDGLVVAGGTVRRVALVLDPGHPGHVVVEMGGETGFGPDGRLAREQALVEEFPAPAVAGDRAVAADGRGRLPVRPAPAPWMGHRFCESAGHCASLFCLIRPVWAHLCRLGSSVLVELFCAG